MLAGVPACYVLGLVGRALQPVAFIAERGYITVLAASAIALIGIMRSKRI